MTINKDFFNGLGETLSKTAKDISEKASSVYETQKIRSKIASEERTIEKLKNDIGSLIFSRFEAGEQPDGELGRLCREISERLVRIDVLERENAGLKGRKLCPSCRREVPMEAMFCPSCGTACPNPDPEPEPEPEPEYKDEESTPFEEFQAEAGEAFNEAAQKTEEAVEEVSAEAEEFTEEFAGAAAEAAEEVQDTVEEIADQVKDAAEEEDFV